MEKWNKGRRKSARSARIVLTRIVLILVVLAGSIALTTSLAFRYRQDLAVLATLALLAVFAIVVSLLLGHLEKFTRLPKFGQYRKSMPASVRVWVEDAIASVMNEMGLPNTEINVWLAPRRFGSSPEIRVTRDNAFHLIIPLGFTECMNRDPEAARAILAHEAAHVAQQDVTLWRLADAYALVIIRVLLPIALVTSGITAFIASEDSDRDVGVAAKAAGTLLVFLLAFVKDGLPALTFFYSIRTLRRRSEALADLGAFLHADGEALRRALTDYVKTAERPVFGIFAIHPSIPWRVSRIDEHSGMILST
ncbi:MAG: M48 family metalloprotease [bacterium]|nr:M48 family metalloprotease [bacterium]